MKKIYLLSLIVFAFSFTTDAQIIDDNFESYNLGPMVNQNPTVWRTWSDGYVSAESITVVNDQANSPSQSGYIGAGPGPQDAVLDLGNQTSGDYTLTWEMYIPAGATAYFNIQGTLPSGTVSGVFNSPNLVFNNTQSANGTPGLGGAYADMADDNPVFSWTYPEDQWFTVEIYFDVDLTNWTMTVDGTQLATQLFATDNVLGGIDFYAIDANNEYWIDDVYFDQGTLSTNDLTATSFKVYPNPVVDNLNIQSNEPVKTVSIYNVLGKLVHQSSPNTVSPSLDMGAYNSGIYFVEVTIGNSTRTVKVIK